MEDNGNLNNQYNTFINKNKQNYYELSDFKEKARRLTNEKINILILETPPYVFKDKIGNIIGIEYDILKEFIKKYELNPNITYLSSDEINQSSQYYIDKVINKEYDILIGNFSINNYRNNIVNFSNPLYTSRPGIFYKKTSQLSNNYYYNIFIIILQFICIVIFFSFVLATIIYYNNSYKLTFRESLWRIAASLFGEPSFEVNANKFNKTFNKSSSLLLILRVFIVFLSTLLGVYLVSIVTSERLVDLSNINKFYDMNSLYNKNILVVKDSFEENFIKDELQKKYNIKITTVEGDYSFKTLVNFYNSNEKKLNIDGFMINSEIFKFQYKGNDYIEENIQFRKTLSGFIFNIDDTFLKDEFNKLFLELYDKSYIIDLCSKYFVNAREKCLQ